MNAKKKKRKKKSKGKRTTYSPALLRSLGLIAALLGFLLYVGTTSYDFAFDDSSVIESNRVVKQGARALPTIFSTPYRYGYWNNEGSLYRPISLAMFALEWEISPNSPGLHHFVNVLLYALTGGVLFLVLFRFLGKKRLWMAFAATCLFVAHPIHTEVVANIKSRDEILALLFGLLALHFLHQRLRSQKLPPLLFSLLAYAAALFSKEGAVTFLAIFPLFLYFFTKQKPPSILRLSAMYLLPVLIFMFARYAVLGTFGGIETEISQLDNYLAHLPLGERLASATLISGLYLFKLVFPHPLFSDLGYPAIPTVGFGHPGALIVLLLWLALLGVAMRGFRKKSIWSFSILYYLATFSIVSNWLLIIGSSYGERFLYAPSLGFCLALAAGLQLLSQKESSASDLRSFFRGSRLPSVALLLVVGLYSLKTLQRHPAWRNSLTLYATDAPQAPDCAKLRYHYGLELNKSSEDTPSPQRKQSMLQQAQSELEASLQLAPSYGDAYAQMGLVHFRSGRPDKALENYRKSLEYTPGKATVYSNMGIIYFQRNQIEKAEEVYTKAVELDPTYVDARRNLGSVYARTGRFDAAIEQFSAALQYAPDDATINYYLGLAWRDKGQPEKGQAYLEKAYRLNPQLKQ